MTSPNASATLLRLASPVNAVPGVTDAMARKLAGVGITLAGHLLSHLPMRHERLDAETAIDQLTVGRIVSARGEVTATRLAGRPGRQRLEAVLSDGTGRLDLVWFNALYMRDKVRPGARLLVQGTLRQRGPSIQISNPKVEVLREDTTSPARSSRLRPIYSGTEGCPSAFIERVVTLALQRLLPLVDDHLSETFRASRHLPDLRTAYRMIHQPEDEAEAAQGRRRLAYDELLLLQLGVHLKRAHLRGTLRAPALRHTARIDEHIRARLPFALTPGQDAVVADLVRDLSTATPTNRLIQGDVGSGKTVVALYAMLLAIASKHQATLMAPTEILAEQHFASISAMLEGSRVRLALLTGSTPEREQESILERLRAGELDLLVGTHALLTERVRFRALGVAVIDEQHRFGVHQRATLRAKGEAVGAQPPEGASLLDVSDRPAPRRGSPVPAALDSAPTHAPDHAPHQRAEVTPHVIVMTATPIPRTLALTLFGDLDISVIRGLPPGRQPVHTRVVPLALRTQAYAEVRERLKAGEQAYVVVPTIDPRSESGAQPIADVRSVVRDLEAGTLAGARIAAIHGRLKRATRERIMERFRAGTIDVLVATTVIEVGVDVPNATVMVVEDADRFGLSQLHQLRGRVGRGSRASLCLLLADPTTPQGAERLRVLESVSDGFELAEKDFEIRGPGEVFGTRQSGLAPFEVAEFPRDLELLAMARRDAAAWIDRSPRLNAPDEALVRRRLLKKHGESLGLADVG